MNEIYEAHLLMEGVWQIIEEAVSMYLIEGSKKALLIDAGMVDADLRAFVEELTDKPVEVVITHGHLDHLRNMNQFDSVYIKEEDLVLVKDSMGGAFQEDRISLMEDGHVFDLGGVKIEVLPMKGHTEGDVVLLDRKRQLLFTNDSIGGGLFVMTLPHSSSLETLRSSMMEVDKTIKGMEDIKIFVAHAGKHDESFSYNFYSETLSMIDDIVEGRILGEEVKHPDPFLSGLYIERNKVISIIYREDKIKEEQKI